MNKSVVETQRSFLVFSTISLVIIGLSLYSDVGYYEKLQANWSLNQCNFSGLV